MKSLSPYVLNKISIKSLSKEIQMELKSLLLHTKINIDGNNLELTTTNTNYKGLRFWIKCPNCHNPVQNVYKYTDDCALKCRVCLKT